MYVSTWLLLFILSLKKLFTTNALDYCRNSAIGMGGLPRSVQIKLSKGVKRGRCSI